MLTDLIQELIKKSAIEQYSMVEETRETAETFFIQKNLDLTRQKKVTEVRLTIYHDFEKNGVRYRGSSQVYIYPEHSRDEIETILAQGYESAGYVENPYFPLPEGKVEQCGVITSDLSEHSLMDSAMAMANALYQADHREDAFLNSIEIFSEKKMIHIMTSAGGDVSYTKYRVYGEYVVQSKANQNDVEQHEQFEYETLNQEALTNRCREALDMVRDRAYAEKAPEDLSAYPIILYGDTVGEFLGFFKERTDASMIYPKYSSYQKGEAVQKEAVGDRLDLDLVPTVPYDAEGIQLETRELLHHGVIRTLHGNAAYASYIGIEPTGTYRKITCRNQGISLDQMKQRPYLLIQKFSDFQIDELDGHFGGEFRLAYLFDGKQTRILTGGTVSGNMLEAQKHFTFSSDRYEDASYSGPIAVRIDTQS